MTHEEMAEWLSNYGGEITYVGFKNISDLFGRSDGLITVAYCSNRVASLCSGPCTVSTGNGICINAPDTNCLVATTDVAFCSNAGCGGGCNVLSECGVKLDRGFCYTPGTNSIGLPVT